MSSSTIFLYLIVATARPINVRLSASDYHYGGRLEIQMAGVWGSVCAVGVDARFAAVVCRQLGLGHSGDVITDSRLGYYPNVSKTGSENLILQIRS